MVDIWFCENKVFRYGKNRAKNEEGFREFFSWIPRVPPSKFKINPQSFWKAHSGYSSEYPLQQIIFPQAPLLLITGWLDEHYRCVNGVAFRFRASSGDVSLTLGVKIGKPIDFLVDGGQGERLVSFTTFLTFRNAKEICGLSVRRMLLNPI